MKNVLLLFTLFFVLKGNNYGQVDVNWSSKYKCKAEFQVFDMVRGSNSEFYVLQMERQPLYSSEPKLILEKYNDKMEQVFSKRLEIPEISGERAKFSNLLYANNRLILLSHIIKNTKNGKKTQAFVSFIDEEGNIADNPQMVGEIGAYNSAFGGEFTLHESKNKKYLVLSGKEEYHLEGKKSNQKYFHAVFDRQLNLIWQKDIELPHPKNKLRKKSIVIDDDGNIYIAVVLSGDKKAVKNDGIIYSYHYKTDKLSSFQIKTPKNWISSIKMRWHEYAKQINIGVLYATDKKLYPVGMESLIYDVKTQRIQSTNHLDFSEALKKDFKRELKGIGKYEDMEDLNLGQVFPRKDGGIYFVGEVVENLFFDKDDQGLYYGKIMVINVDAQGKIVWIKKVDREIYAEYGDLNWPTFCHAIKLLDENSGKLHLILNSGPKNRSRVAEYSNAIVVSIDESGDMKTTTLFENHDEKNDEIIFRPGIFCSNTKDNIVIAYGFEKMSAIVFKAIHKFCRITIE